jgi:hypothetical protein
MIVFVMRACILLQMSSPFSARTAVSQELADTVWQLEGQEAPGRLCFVFYCYFDISVAR